MQWMKYLWAVGKEMNDSVGIVQRLFPLALTRQQLRSFAQRSDILRCCNAIRPQIKNQLIQFKLNAF